MLTSQTIESPFHEAGFQESRPMIVLEEDPVRGGNSVAATVHDVRVRVVGAVVGGLLLGLGGLGLALAAAWHMPSVTLLAGSYGTVGSMAVVASSVHA